MKIAAIQMCSSRLVKENLQQAAKLIGEAASKGASLVVLPEMFAIMGFKAEDKVSVKENFGEGLVQDFLAQQAVRHKIWIVAGTIPIATEVKNKVRAACLVYSDTGIVVARYDKIHLFDVSLSATEVYRESDSTEPGSEAVVIDTPVGKLGLAVCYDLRFPELFRHLVNQGAELIAVPAAFTVKTGMAHWELLLRARAVENFCYLIGAAQGGVHFSGRESYGHSMIVNPWGELMAHLAGVSSGVIYAEIDLGYLKTIRASIPALKHQRKID